MKYYKTSSINEPKKSNYLVIVLIIAGLIFLYYNAFKRDKYSISNTEDKVALDIPSYTLIETERNDKFAFNASVRIPCKISDFQLKQIAIQVKSELKTKTDRGVIFFLLPEMKVQNNGAWAAVDFPEQRIRIIGQSIADEQTIKESANYINNYEGLWSDDGSQGDVIIGIRKNKQNGYIWEYLSATDLKPSKLSGSPLRRTTKNGQTVYIDLESAISVKEYYVVEPNGNLSAYDKDGYITTFTRLK